MLTSAKKKNVPSARKAKSGMPVTAINQVAWIQSEPGTDVSEAISLAYAHMRVSEDRPLTVHADGSTESELYAFRLVGDTRIAKGADSMLGEYAEFVDQCIVSFTMREHFGGPAFDLWINLGEGDKTPKPPARNGGGTGREKRTT